MHILNILVRILKRMQKRISKIDSIQIDRWLSEGFSIIDIGILLGFKPLGSDLTELISHASKYIQSGAEVYISTPRIKNGIIDDNQYIQILQSIYKLVPSSKLIITTRESIDFINKTVTIKHTVLRFSEIIEKDTVKTENRSSIHVPAECFAHHIDLSARISFTPHPADPVVLHRAALLLQLGFLDARQLADPAV